MNNLIYLLPAAIVGAAVSYIFPFAVGTFPYLFRTLQHQHLIEGKWYSYHYTRQSNQPRVRELQWRVKRGMRGDFMAVCRDKNDASRRRTSNYGKGKVFAERGHLVLELLSQQDHSRITCRLLEPIATNDVTPGIWLAFDLDGTLVAGPIIFTRNELIPSDIERVLKSRISAVPAYKLLEVPTQVRAGAKKSAPAP